MLRFCDKEVCCISYKELNRGILLNYFLQGNMDEMVCIINDDGTYRGRIMYYSLLNSNNIEDAVLEDYVILDRDLWKHARDFFAGCEQDSREHILLPVLDEQKRLVSFAYEDDEANRELRMLKELEELPGAISFTEIYPQYESVKIYGFNELALCFAEYLRKQGICVETDGELWERFFPDGSIAEVPDYKRLIIYAEGVHDGRHENWVENLLSSVSPEFECIDCIYEANWKVGIIKDTETDIAGLLDELKDTDKEVAILGTDMEAQNVYDFLKRNGIEAEYFVSDIPEETQHLLFGKKVLKSTELWQQRSRMILLECQEQNSALGIPILEKYDYLGFKRNRDLFFLKDYVEIPYDNLRHILKNQCILFVGDVLLCERIARYLKKNIEVKEMFFSDVSDEEAEAKEKGVLQQVKLAEVDKDVLCLIVFPEYAAGFEAKIFADSREWKQEVNRILRKNDILNYTDYFSYMRTFISLEKDMTEKGLKKERFMPRKIIFGAIESCNGNYFVKCLLDNHPSILMISDYSYFNNNLFWICVRLADIPSERIMPLFKSIYRSESNIDLHSIELFEEKVRELLEPGERYTSQELFVIFLIAYIYMYGRDIDNIKDMVIYWEPHNMRRSIMEEFVEWVGESDGLCSILNVVRNICMVKGSVLKGRLVKGWKVGGSLVGNVVYADTFKKDWEGCERYVVRFEDIKLEPRKTLSDLCRKWGILWSETLMETTRYGQKHGYDNGYKNMQDFDLEPVYNNYEEYFSAFDRFRITLICATWQKKYGYPYVEISDFTRRELQEMFLKEFRFEKELPYNGQKWIQDGKIQDQEGIRRRLWEVRKQELLEKYSEIGNC